MVQEPTQSVSNSSGFVTFAKCFCINPVYSRGLYKKRKGWVLIDLATRAETNFKRLCDAKHHLMCLYLEAAPKNMGQKGAEALLSFNEALP
jgi:hypothetical protein